jgi:hypothetical protein
MKGPGRRPRKKNPPEPRPRGWTHDPVKGWAYDPVGLWTQWWSECSRRFAEDALELKARLIPTQRLLNPLDEILAAAAKHEITATRWPNAHRALVAYAINVWGAVLRAVQKAEAGPHSDIEITAELIAKHCAAAARSVVKAGEPLPWLPAAVKMESAAAIREAASRKADQGTGDEPPPMPLALFMSLPALADALRVPGKVNAIDIALRRFAKKCPDCRDEIGNPKSGESRILYRVPMVWGHLIERLPRWRGR